MHFIQTICFIYLITSSSLLLYSQSFSIANLPATQQLNRNHWNASVQYMKWEEALDFPSKLGIKQKGEAFIEGLALDNNTHFALERTQYDLAQQAHLRFQQYYKGLPVFGAHIDLHFTTQKKISQLTSSAIQHIGDYPNRPKHDYFTAITKAIRFIKKEHPTIDKALDVVSAELVLYNNTVLQQQQGAFHLAYAIVLSNQEHIRSLVFVDAVDNYIIDAFSKNCTLLDRQLYLSSTSNEIWQEGQNFPGQLDPWQQRQITVSEQTYNLFFHTFQHNSYDNAGAPMRMIDQAVFLDCPNASWNGHTVNFCSQVSSDDVVAHEWAHAYTEYSCDLIYAWEAGAINEALSDIWGETLDLINDNVENHQALRSSCSENNVRWKIAEEALATNGAIRDMWDPNCFNDPARVRDSLYHCVSTDFGGVHSNSGIINHAYALLVDGGSFNNYNIQGIGLTKAAHIFWQAQQHYLGRTSNYSELATALSAACQDLYNINLPELTIANSTALPSGQMIGSFDSLQLAKVLLAVELKDSIAYCEQTQILTSNTPAICTDPAEGFLVFFEEDFEDTPALWQLDQLAEDTASWQERNWIQKSNLPAGRAGKAMFASSPNIGNCSDDLQNGILRLESPSILIPPSFNNEDILLSFTHYFALEHQKDGGNLKLKKNNGNWLNIPPSMFTHNGYNSHIQSHSNPMHLKSVYTGTNNNSISGNWATSHIDLGFLNFDIGDELRFRWELGTDACDGLNGWYIDDIRLGWCSPDAALPVDYLYFKAEEQAEHIHLSWATSLENNNKGFYIERNTNAKDFEPIGWVAAQGSHYNYLFVDDEVKGLSNIYYRLRQEDFDGSFAYSAIRHINRTTLNEWSIGPNPAKEQLNIHFTSPPLAPIQVAIYNNSGQLVKTFSAPSTEHFIHLDVSSLTAALYWVRLESNGTHHLKPVLLID